MYRGLIAAAGLSSRLQDLGEKRNKVLSDLGGQTILGHILDHFEKATIAPTYVVVGHDANNVRNQMAARAEAIFNPFYEHYGILASIWQARPHLEGQPFVFTTGDHYFGWERFQTFLADQPTADVLVDVELKTCDEEDMKVFLNRQGRLRTMTKTFLDSPCIGEFTGAVRFSAEGSQQLFETLDKHVWQHGIQGYLADILCHLHRKWELNFHLSSDHHRVDVDFPYDLTRARDLYKQHRISQRQTG